MRTPLAFEGVVGGIAVEKEDRMYNHRLRAGASINAATNKQTETQTHDPKETQNDLEFVERQANWLMGKSPSGVHPEKKKS